jgi:hypothetical protein
MKHLLLAAAIAVSVAPLPKSLGLYRLPYADGTAVKVFDDTTTHRPRGRTDLFGVEGQGPYRAGRSLSGPSSKSAIG